jgi:hypothetical protein
MNRWPLRIGASFALTMGSIIQAAEAPVGIICVPAPSPTSTLPFGYYQTQWRPFPYSSAAPSSIAVVAPADAEMIAAPQAVPPARKTPVEPVPVIPKKAPTEPAPKSKTPSPAAAADGFPNQDRGEGDKKVNAERKQWETDAKLRAEFIVVRNESDLTTKIKPGQAFPYVVKLNGELVIWEEPPGTHRPHSLAPAADGTPAGKPEQVGANIKAGGWAKYYPGAGVTYDFNSHHYRLAKIANDSPAEKKKMIDAADAAFNGIWVDNQLKVPAPDEPVSRPAQQRILPPEDLRQPPRSVAPLSNQSGPVTPLPEIPILPYAPDSQPPFTQVFIPGDGQTVQIGMRVEQKPKACLQPPVDISAPSARGGSPSTDKDDAPRWQASKFKQD